MSDLMRAYHDEEWGVPVRDDRKLFEYLVLDAFQAGLSWHIILKKREGFREAFQDFDPRVVAEYTSADVERLVASSSIVRNRLKVKAAVSNAAAFLQVQRQFGAFSDYMWAFVGDRTIQDAWTVWQSIPSDTEESRLLSADLRRRGFKFVGPTIIYAVMQSAGLVNDHSATCFRYKELGGTATGADQAPR